MSVVGGETRRRMDDFRTLARLSDVALAVSIGLAVYLVTAWLIVGRWQVMPIGLARTVQIQRFLDRQAQARAYDGTYCLGSSVAVEGVDCSVIDEVLGERHSSYNLAWTGAGPSNWLLLLPALRDCRPRTVVLVTDLSSLRARDPIPEEMLNIFAWNGFLPESKRETMSTVLTDSERRMLISSPVAQLLRFRMLPLGAFDTWVRETARPDLRYDDYATNFKAPWVRRLSVSPVALERHLDQLSAGLTDVGGDGRADAMGLLRFIVDYLAQRNGHAVIVLSPLHPELARRIGTDRLEKSRRLLLEWCRQNGVAFLDHSTFLRAEEYSDGVHPNESGRRRWSAELGRALKPLGSSAGV